MRNTVCKDCNERNLGCHIMCNKYKQFKKDLEEYNKQHRKNMIYISYIGSKIHK